MTIELFSNIAWGITGIAALCVLHALIRFREREYTTRIVSLYFLLTTLTTLSLYVLPMRGKEVNIPQSLCAILQFIVIGWLYDISLNGRYRRFVVSTTIVYVVFAVVNLAAWQKLDNNSYTLAFSALLILIHSVIYWYRLLVDLPVQQLHKLPMFWYNSGLLINSAGTLFLYLFTAYLTEVLHNDLLIYWTFHNIIKILQNIVMSIGIWQDLQNIKSRSSLPSVQ